MKNKGVLISMAVIFVIGVLITKGTHNFIESNSSGADMAAAQAITEAFETAAQEDMAEAAEETKSVLTADMAAGAAAHDLEGADGVQVEIASLMDTILEDDAGDALSGRGSEASLADSKSEEESREVREMAPEVKDNIAEAALTPITPLDTPPAAAEERMDDAESNGERNSAAAELQSYYTKRFRDLDNQIQKNRDSQTNSNANNSARSIASNELKLWDSELNSIYNAILERLNQERSEELVEEQRAWLKERDSIAMEAVKNSSGGSSESLEYTVSLTESTRARAYELAEIYEAELAE